MPEGVAKVEYGEMLQRGVVAVQLPKASQILQKKVIIVHQNLEVLSKRWSVRNDKYNIVQIQVQVLLYMITCGAVIGPSTRLPSNNYHHDIA